MDVVTWYIIAFMVFHCDAVTFEEQLEHIAKRRQESRGIYDAISSRRFDDKHMSVILGAPSMPSHLPEAEPILPGHTLLRPARGMLKSAVKFPHRDLDNGAGVYGNVKNLGIRYDGRNERVQYSGFRRMPNDLVVTAPKSQPAIPQFSLSSFFELSDRSEEYEVQPLRHEQWPRPKRIQGLLIKVSPSKKEHGKKSERTDTTDQNTKSTHNIIVPASYHKSMINKIDTGTPKKKRFGPPGQKNWIKTVPDLESMQRGREEEAGVVDNNIIILDNGESSNEDYKDTENEVKKKTVESKEEKLEWFWKSKDAYNNIQINPEAPELTELIPEEEKEKIRQWWFYHQEDFEPFKD